jgi:hypothetical protein
MYESFEFVDYEIKQKLLWFRPLISEFKYNNDKQTYKITMTLVERYEGMKNHLLLQD